MTFVRNNVTEKLTGFDTIISAWGLTPNNSLADDIRDTVSEVHVIGDAVKIRSAVQAIAEAAQVATHI